MLAGPDASATSDTTLRVVGHTGYTDDAKVTHMGLVTVIRTTGNVDFNVIVAGEDDGLNFPGQLKSVAIAADAVVVADAGSDIPGANRGISLSGIPGMGFMSDGIHLHTAQLRIHFPDVCLQILVDRRNIFIGNAGDVKGLPGTKMEIAVTPGLGDMFHIAEILGIYRAAWHTHLKHKFSGHFGLPVAVQPKLFDRESRVRKQ